MPSHCLRLFAALAIAGVIRTVHAQTTDAKPAVPEIRTAATVQRSVRPNLATLTLQLQAKGRSPREAGERLARRVDSLRRALGAAGIQPDSLVSASQWYWWPNRISVHPGSTECVPVETPAGRGCTYRQDTMYTAHERLTARIRDLDRVGAVMDTALAHRITEIFGPHFTATDVSVTQQEALREATSRARRQAEAMAGAAGAQLGRLVSLSTQGDPSLYYGLGLMEASSYSAGAQPATVIVAPSVQVTVTVYGRWELLLRP